MGFFSPDMEPLIDIYQSETTELIGEMDGYLIRAEREHHLTEEAINSIFRVVHSIKSSSAMMGMEDMSTCTHHLEDLFYLFREDPSLMQGKEEGIFSLLYTYSDYVKDEIERITDQDFQPSQITELMAQITKELELYKNIPAKEDSSEAQENQENIQKTSTKKEEKSKTDTPTGEILEKNLRVILKENCQMESVRAFLLVNQIKGMCEQIAYQPENLEVPEAIDEIRENGFLLYLRSDKARMGKIITKLDSSPYVENVEDMSFDESVSKEVGTQAKDESEDVHADKKEEPTEQPVVSRSGKFSSVPWEKIVKLQEVTGELITSHTIINHQMEKLGDHRVLENFSLTFHKLLSDLEELVNSASLMPVSGIVPQLYRIVRDICKKEKKEVNFVVEGQEIEADKNLIDTMVNPLIHLIRNSIDHGIEAPDERIRQGKNPTGEVSLQVSSADGRLRFCIKDDGIGLNAKEILEQAKSRGLLVKAPEAYTQDEIVNFILMPGFSTTVKVNEYSGRGVGMDVVRNAVDVLGGILEVHSDKGQGTEIIMEVPVSMTSVESIHFMVGNVNCLLPIRSIDRIHSMDEIKAQISTVDGRELYQGSNMLPILRMREVFDLPGKSDQEYMLILQGIRSAVCIIVDEVMGQLTAVEKKLPELFGSEYRASTGISGCAIIGDGDMAMMLNAEKLIRLYQKGLEDDARAKLNEQT
ncbi:MAG: hypothetical protein EOM40_13370 [Clostridia bacterium]|nr:hypothetical protein [Clostridia bacterium]NCC42634.1 hypothetical protein [Clostridia bacterium]